jgi:hypothetical protein
MNTVRCFALLLYAVSCTPALAQLQYVPLPSPCRAVDTRVTGGAIAAGAFSGTGWPFKLHAAQEHGEGAIDVPGARDHSPRAGRGTWR